MSSFIPGWNPPSSVPGPYSPPYRPVNGLQSVSLPRWRVVDAPAATSLHQFVQKIYGDLSKAIQVFNDNMIGTVHPDGSSGFMANPNQEIQPGDRIWLSS